MLVKVIFLFLLASTKVQSDSHDREYFVYEKETEFSFSEARQKCREKGQILAMPKTPIEYEQLKAFVGGLNYEGFYIGLKRDTGKKFIYANGEKLTYVNWHHTQPDTGDALVKGCAAGSANHGGQWLDQPCILKQSYVCMFYDKQAKPFYVAFTSGLDYIDAVISCLQKGGEIAMPRSAADDGNILTAYENTTLSHVYWIGVQRKRVNWRWIDGEIQTFSWNAWVNGQPNNGHPGERCAGYVSTRGGWSDYICNSKFNGYVCQNLYDVCADKKPWACKQRVRGLKADAKSEYCNKIWPTENCKRTCANCP